MKMIQLYSTVQKNTQQRGSILVLTLVISVMIMILGTNVAQIIVAQQATFKQQATADTALVAADTGVKAAIAQLNKNSGWTDFGGSPTLTEQAFDSTSTYTVKVTPIDDDFKRIDATGKTYKDTTKTVVVNTKKLQVVVAAKRNPVTESIVIGSGGLHLYPNSFIPENSVNVRGSLTMESGSSIGVVGNAPGVQPSGSGVRVNLSNTSCAVGSSPVTEWPVRCTSSAPLTMAASARINGTVCANDNSLIAPGANIIDPDTGASGVLTTCKPPIVDAPRFDKASFIADNITTSAPGDPASAYQCAGGSSQTVPVPNGTRIRDSLMTNPMSTDIAAFKAPSTYTDTFNRASTYPPSMTTNNFVARKCTLLIEGNVYIDGDLFIHSGTRLRVQDNIEPEDAPIIVVNGRVKFRSADTGIGNLAPRNNLGTPVYIISFDSLDEGCSRSNTEPNANVQSCVTPNAMNGSDGILTDQEAMDSAAVGVPPASVDLCSVNCGPYDLSGIALYYYFADFESLNEAKNNNYQIYALGAQGLVVPHSTNFTTAAPNAPFANLLDTVRWWPVDYKQIYD